MNRRLNDLAPICLIAGRGALPVQIADELKRRAVPFRVLALRGFFDSVNLKPDATVSWDRWGELRDCFQEWQIRSVIFAGKVDRPNLLQLRPDATLLAYLPKIGLALLGDDGVMRRVVEIFEKDFGLTILGPQEILQQRRGLGALGHYSPSEAEEWDIQRGLQALRALSHADFGQAVVVEGGVILGVEAIEGTDALIERTGLFKRQDAAGVIVKMPKVQQDIRIDPPVIGVETLQAAHRAGFSGLAIAADGIVIIDEAQVIALADELGLFLSTVCYPEDAE